MVDLQFPFFFRLGICGVFLIGLGDLGSFDAIRIAPTLAALWLQLWRLDKALVHFSTLPTLHSCVRAPQHLVTRGTQVVAGYRRASAAAVGPGSGLTSAEAAALPVCVAARLAQSVLTSARSIRWEWPRCAKRGGGGKKAYVVDPPTARPCSPQRPCTLSVIIFCECRLGVCVLTSFFTIKHVRKLIQRPVFFCAGVTGTVQKMLST